MTVQQRAKCVLAGRWNNIVIDGRHQRAEYRAKAKNYGAAKRDAQIAHAQAVSKAADTPKQAHQVGPADNACTGISDDIGKAGYSEPRRQRRHDEPGKQPAHDPETFPGPALYLFVRYIKTSRGKAPDEVEYDAEDDLHGLS